MSNALIDTVAGVAPRPTDVLPPTRCEGAHGGCFLFVEWVVVKGAVWVAGSLWRAGRSFLFRRLGRRRVFVGAVSASQFHAGPSGDQKAAGACRDGGGVGGGARARRLERLLAREDVPGGDQDLARDGGFGGVLARAFGDVVVEPSGFGGGPGGG
jgi:hypothetical protein